MPAPSVRCLALLLCSLWCLAGTTVAADPPDTDHRSGVLFEICAPGAEGPSYLFGTLHSEDPRVLSLPRPVWDAFARSHSFALEAVPDARAIMESMLVMTYTDGRTLREVLPRELYRDVAAAMGERGMPLGAYRDFKPWAVITLLSVPPSEGGRFLDLHLYDQAMAEGKRVEGLETMGEQLEIFEGLELEDQVALLRQTLAMRYRLPELFDALLKGYLDRNLDALVAASDRYLSGADERLVALFRDSALISRNQRMVERMLSLLDEGGWFIAVGALHLPSPSGILSLLERRGYKITSLY